MILTILKYVAALGTILTGLISLFWPRRVRGFTGLEVQGGRGVTEIRAVLGAFFVGLGGAALYFNSAETYQMLGATYLLVGLVRGIAMFIDDSVVSSNIISVVVEVIFGIVLIL